MFLFGNGYAYAASSFGNITAPIALAHDLETGSLQAEAGLEYSNVMRYCRDSATMTLTEMSIPEFVLKKVVLISVQDI